MPMRTKDLCTCMEPLYRIDGQIEARQSPYLTTAATKKTTQIINGVHPTKTVVKEK